MPESPEVLSKFNAKRKSEGKAYALETGHESWQGACRKCKWSGPAGLLGSVLSDCVRHDSYSHR